MEYAAKFHQISHFRAKNAFSYVFTACVLMEPVASTPMKKNRTPDAPDAPELALEKVEKGSKPSMWEVLLQLRVLLPYVSRLLPLLDGGLGGLTKASPDLSEVQKGLAEMQTGNRELEVMTRNHAVQLERIEQQMTRLRAVHENSLEESRLFFSDMRSLRRWVISMGIVLVLLVFATGAMVAFLIMHS
jgi:hypothetical protein